MGLADEVRRRAFELANSGRHIDCITIENQLDDEGFPEAYVVLQDAQLRAALKAICDEHWRSDTSGEIGHRPSDHDNDDNKS